MFLLGDVNVVRRYDDERRPKESIAIRYARRTDVMPRAYACGNRGRGKRENLCVCVCVSVCVSVCVCVS